MPTTTTCPTSKCVLCGCGHVFFSYEHCVLFTVAIGSSHVIGTAFVTCVRFLIGIVMTVVLGRDLVLLHQIGDTLILFLALCHAILICSVVSNCMMQPVFWSSQSFPNGDAFVDVLAGTMTATALMTGTLVLRFRGRSRRSTTKNL